MYTVCLGAEDEEKPRLLKIFKISEVVDCKGSLSHLSIIFLQKVD
jgi:hypothetical protein